MDNGRRTALKVVLVGVASALYEALNGKKFGALQAENGSSTHQLQVSLEHPNQQEALARIISLDKYGDTADALEAALAEAKKTDLQTIDVTGGAKLDRSVTVDQDIALTGTAAPQWHEQTELSGDSLLTATQNIPQLLLVPGRVRQPSTPLMIGSFSLSSMKLQGRSHDGQGGGEGALDGVVCTAGGGPMSPFLLRNNHARGFRHVYSFRMPGGRYPTTPDIAPNLRGQEITTGAFDVEIDGGTYTYNENMLHASGKNAIGNVSLRNVINRHGGRVYTEPGSVYGAVSVSDMLSEGQTRPYRWGLALANLTKRRIYFEDNWETDTNGNPLYVLQPDGSHQGVAGCIMEVSATNPFSTADIADIYVKNDGYYAKFEGLSLSFDAERVAVRLRRVMVRKLRARSIIPDLQYGDLLVNNVFALDVLSGRPLPSPQPRGGATSGYEILGSVRGWTPFGNMDISTASSGYARLTFPNFAGDTLEICCLAWTESEDMTMASVSLVDINTGAGILGTGPEIRIPAGEVIVVHIAVPLPEAHGGFLFKLIGAGVRFATPYALAKPGGAPMTLWVPKS